MKKLQLAMVLGMALASGSVFAAEQGHGTVNFKGEIIEAPCSITADTVEQTVDLGQVSSSALKAGGKSSPKAFSIKLEDCDVTALTNKTVTATFTGKGASFDTSSSLLALAGSAAGAGIAITDDNSSVIKLGTASTAYTFTDASTEAELRYSAYLQGAADNTATPIVAGEFTSVANYTLAYQ
ncbi:fimbrial protein [Pantoea agglomerans]|uniref:fimbrial protein n=1 Tax=Enterobacter agglomerans TaxID=549 RepID=UPI003C7A110C